MPYFSSVFRESFLQQLVSKRRTRFLNGLWGDFISNKFYGMINALLNYLDDRFTVGQTPEEQLRHRKTASLLALLPAGATLCKCSFLIERLYFDAWNEIFVGGMTALQSWLFGLWALLLSLKYKRKVNVARTGI